MSSILRDASPLDAKRPRMGEPGYWLTLITISDGPGAAFEDSALLCDSGYRRATSEPAALNQLMLEALVLPPRQRETRRNVFAHPDTR